MEQLRMDIDALRSMHRFGDVMEDAIKSIDSEVAEFTAIRDAKDCIGRHWYGMRCQVRCRRSGTLFYLHMGLIYFPSTRPGLMIELDEQNNGSVYASVLANIKERAEFEINRDEAEYFKLFMPDAVFANMSGRARGEQVRILREYIQNGAEAMVEAAYLQGFTINYQNMSDALHLAEAFERTLQESDPSYGLVEINYADKDNFGQYASGYRYYLSNPEKTVTFYAYFGAIYSYKKEPAGIFAEIDWFSNQEVFDPTFAQMMPNPAYRLSVSEPRFIKLFMTDEQVQTLNGSSYEEQIKQLKEFLNICNDELIKAYQKGGN